MDKKPSPIIGQRVQFDRIRWFRDGHTPRCYGTIVNTRQILKGREAGRWRVRIRWDEWEDSRYAFLLNDHENWQDWTRRITIIEEIKTP